MDILLFQDRNKMFSETIYRSLNVLKYNVIREGLRRQSDEIRVRGKKKLKPCLYRCG